MTVLVAVLLLSVIAVGVAVAAHTMWRGSSRTLFSVQENRLMGNLGRSALTETYFELQRSLDSSRAVWLDWFTGAESAPVTHLPRVTRDNAALLPLDPAALSYTAGEVTIRRVVGLDREAASEGQMGLVDISLTVEVNRAAPKHRARITMSERRTWWLVDQLGPYGSAGRHVELSATPVGTWIEER